MVDDRQWPSEDEDFDSTIDKAMRSANVSDVQAPPQRSAGRSVAISEPEDDAAEPEAAAPEESEEPTANPEETAPEVPEEEPEQPSVEPEAVAPEAAVAVADVKPPKPPKPPKSPKTGKSIGRTVLEVVLVLAVVGLGLWAWSLYTDNKDLKQQVAVLNNNPQVAVQKQTQQLIAQVGQLIQLPSGETPTIANVSDASQAKQQSAFFANAQNGDKVLMYVKAGEAILYRPSTGKIILVAPLTFTSNSSTTTTPSTTTTKK